MPSQDNAPGAPDATTTEHTSVPRWFTDDGSAIPTKVLCDPRGFPHQDELGREQYDNTHFDNEHDAWVSGRASVEAWVSLELREVTQRVASLRKSIAELEAAIPSQAAFYTAMVRRCLALVDEPNEHQRLAAAAEAVEPGSSGDWAQAAADLRRAWIDSGAVGLLRSAGYDDAAELLESTVTWAENDVDEPSELPRFPDIGCDRDCGFARRGAGFSCVEGTACGRRVAPGEPHYDELEAYDEAMTLASGKTNEEPDHAGARNSPGTLSGVYADGYAAGRQAAGVAAAAAAERFGYQPSILRGEDDHG